MPVEIRELLIRTEITSSDKPQSGEMSQKQRKILKQEILQECTKRLRRQLKNPSLER